MNTSSGIKVKLWSALTAALVAVVVILPAMVLANTAPASSSVRAAASSPQGAVYPELIRLGFTSEGDASYTNLVGRSASNVASFRSNRGVSDIYYIFPAPAHTLNVISAQMNVITSTGTYTGTANVTLEVRDMSGALLHTVSSTALDLEAAPIGSWTPFAISTTPSDTLVDPGQVLVVHVTFDLGSSDDLNARPMFEVYVN